MESITVEQWYDKGVPETVSVKRGEIYYPVNHASRSQGTVWTGKYYLWADENPDLEFELENWELVYFETDERTDEPTTPKINPLWVSAETSSHQPAPASPSNRRDQITEAIAVIDDRINAELAPQLWEQVKIMWKVIDQLNTAALDAERGMMPPTALQNYVKDKTNAVLRLISFPGEPDKNIMFDAGLGWDEDTEEGESDRD